MCVLNCQLVTKKIQKQFATSEDVRCRPPDEFCYRAVKNLEITFQTANSSDTELVHGAFRQ